MDTGSRGDQVGYLLALNKWECPVLITAFSAFTVSYPTKSRRGLRAILSQSQKRFVVVEPVLGAECSIENEKASSKHSTANVDESIRYCQANVGDSSSDSSGWIYFRRVFLRKILCIRIDNF